MCHLEVIAHNLFYGLILCRFVFTNTLDQETPSNTVVWRNLVYPPEGGLKDELVAKVPKAMTGGAEFETESNYAFLYRSND